MGRDRAEEQRWTIYVDPETGYWGPYSSGYVEKSGVEKVEVVPAVRVEELREALELCRSVAREDWADDAGKLRLAIENLVGDALGGERG